jgi:hypothetical protein
VEDEQIVLAHLRIRLPSDAALDFGIQPAPIGRLHCEMTRVGVEKRDVAIGGVRMACEVAAT